jgi:hypothetical protein
VIFQSTKTKEFFFVANFDKNLGCYRLPPLKEISPPRFEEARKVEGFWGTWVATTLKRDFCG